MGMRTLQAIDDFSTPPTALGIRAEPFSGMLSSYDYFIVGIYLVFLASTGLVFKRFNKNTTDYFAGGFRMSWWLVGTSVLITNVSCWLFTGASEIAYDYGWLILAAVYFNDLIGFALAALYFAPRFRQLRVVTSIDAVRMRFGRVNEQFFNWIQILTAFLQSAVGLVGLSVILSTVLRVDQESVIVATGGVVLLIALLGGSWGVAGSGFVQLTMLTAMTLVVAVMTLVRLGGVHAFLAQIPPDHWEIFKPAGSTKYDWVFIVTGWLASLIWRNNLGVTWRYVPARDSEHARKAALVPVMGYLILPLFWFIPPLAAHTLVPTLARDFPSMNPGEASYFAVCKLVLPQGLMGLMVATMLSVTMGGMDVALNKNAAIFVKNFYKPVLRKNASDRELFVAGWVATLVSGMLTILAATLFTGEGKASLFDLYQYLNAYLWMPVGVTLALAMWVKHSPRWAAWGTVVWGVMLSVFLYEVLPMAAVGRVCVPVLGERFYGYLVSNKFAATNFLAIPLTALFFLGTKAFYKPAQHKSYERQVERFFRRMETPVDFEREVGHDNSRAQALVLSRVMGVYAVLVSLILLVPNTAEGRVGIGACAGGMFVIAGGMRLYARHLGRKGPQVEKPQAEPVAAMRA
ncbi:MAG: sodium:solute symporter family transporter [Phycisphaerae bacterium]